MDVRAQVVFHGKVQGVWFRANTQKFAVEQGIKGTVRNLPNGSVEAIFEGEKEDVDILIQRCRVGQPMAKVTASMILWLDATGEFDGYEILR